MDMDPQKLESNFLKRRAEINGEIIAHLRRSETVVFGDTETRKQSGDFGDLASVESNRFQADSIIKSMKYQIALIDAAISRLRENPDNFGYCQECGEKIDPNRLISRPHSLHCVPCKSAAEKAAKVAGKNRLMQPAYT